MYVLPIPSIYATNIAQASTHKISVINFYSSFFHYTKYVTQHNAIQFTQAIRGKIKQKQQVNTYLCDITRMLLR